MKSYDAPCTRKGRCRAIWHATRRRDGASARCDFGRDITDRPSSSFSHKIDFILSREAEGYKMVSGGSRFTKRTLAWQEQSCVKTFLLSYENHSKNVPLPTPKLHNGAIFQQAIPETGQECLYTTLYSLGSVLKD